MRLASKEKLPPKVKTIFGSVSIGQDLNHKKEIRKIVQAKQKWSNIKIK